MKPNFALVFVGISVITACSKKETDPIIQLPTAGFSFPALTESGTEISFQNTSQNATRYKWNFGDGKFSTNGSPSHIYPYPGRYTVTLNALNARADSATITKQIFIRPYNIFAHFNIPNKTAYRTRGNRSDTYFSPNPGSSSSRLRDSTFTIIYVSPDSLRINGYLATQTRTGAAGFPKVSATNPYIYQVQVYPNTGPLVDATFLGLYAPGDSIIVRQFSHVGHYSSRQDTYSGPRIP